MSHIPHSHSHTASSQRGLHFAAALTFFFALVEAAAGWWSNSLALISDAGHMLTDTGALLVASLGAWLAQRKPSSRHSYGLGRAEFIAALINGIFMLGLVASIAYHAVERLTAPPEVKGEAMTLVAFIGLLVNILVLRILGHDAMDLNRRAAMLHVMGDLLGSLAALLAGVVIIVTGWTPIDPALSLVIVVLILFSTLRLLHEATHGLMEGVPLGLSLEAIGLSMASHRRVRSVHDLHVWSLSPTTIALSAHVVLDDMGDWPCVLRDLRERLDEEYGIGHITLQPESTTQAVKLSSVGSAARAKENPV